MKRSTYVHSSNKYNAQTSLAIYCHWWLTILTLIVSKVSIISFTRTSLQNYYSSIVGHCSAAAKGQQWRPLLPFCWYFDDLVYFPSDLFLDWLRSIFESFAGMYVSLVLFWQPCTLLRINHLTYISDTNVNQSLLQLSLFQILSQV